MHGAAGGGWNSRNWRRRHDEFGQLHSGHHHQSGVSPQRPTEHEHDGNSDHGQLHESRTACQIVHGERIDFELPLERTKGLTMRIMKSQRGFSLLELLVASSIGLTVLLVMTSLFKTGMDATMKVTQRAETQQNMRAAVEFMTKDIGLAG